MWMRTVRCARILATFGSFEKSIESLWTLTKGKDK